MAAFQYKFFRTVYDAKELGTFKVNNPVKAAYCSYNNQVLQLVVSSLYISALFSGIIASKFARLYGRKVSPSLSPISMLSRISFPVYLHEWYCLGHSGIWCFALLFCPFFSSCWLSCLFQYLFSVTQL